MSIVAFSAFICTICGGHIGYLVGYSHGNKDMKRIYEDVYKIKDVN